MHRLHKPAVYIPLWGPICGYDCNSHGTFSQGEESFALFDHVLMFLKDKISKFSYLCNERLLKLFFYLLIKNNQMEHAEITWNYWKVRTHYKNHIRSTWNTIKLYQFIAFRENKWRYTRYSSTWPREKPVKMLVTLHYPYTVHKTADQGISIWGIINKKQQTIC